MAQDMDPIDNGKNDRPKSLYTCFFCANTLPINKVCVFIGDTQQCKYYLQNEVEKTESE